MNSLMLIYFQVLGATCVLSAAYTLRDYKYFLLDIIKAYFLLSMVNLTMAC